MFTGSYWQGPELDFIISVIYKIYFKLTHQVKNSFNMKGVIDVSPPKSYKAKPRDLDDSGNIISK